MIAYILVINYISDIWSIKKNIKVLDEGGVRSN